MEIEQKTKIHYVYNGIEYDNYEMAKEMKMLDEVELLVYANFYDNSTKAEIVKKIMENRDVLGKILSGHDDDYYY